MASNFIGSIAQTQVSYSIQETQSSVVGQNFYTTIIYVSSVSDAAANFVTPPGINAYATLNASNYSTLVKGPLLTQLTPYFESDTGNNVLAVEFDGTDTATWVGLGVAYQLTKALGFFKLIFDVGTAGAAAVALGTLCNQDKLLSQFWQGTSDSGVLSSPQTTGIGYELLSAAIPVQAVVIYSAQSTINPALAQLGLTLGILNSSGTPVGNRTGYIQTNTILPSGTTGTDYTNLSSTNQTNLESNNIGFFATVNEGVNVACIGELTNTGNDSASQWLESYVNYLCDSYTAAYLTSGNNAFKTNQTYQAIKGIIYSILYPFTTGSVIRLSNLSLTGTTFGNLPPTAGNSITIPNAWSATFNRGLQKVLVQGNINITIP